MPFPLEFQLLALCSQVAPTHQDIEEIKNLLSKKLDWKHFLRLSSIHRQNFLTYLHLQRFSEEKIPPQILHQLKGKAQKQAFKNLLYLSELIRLLAILTDNSVNAYILKGLPIAERYYGNISYRHMSDIDILINPNQFQMVLKLLEREGYIGQFNISSEEEKIHIKRTNQQTFNHPKGVLLEIHWRFFANDESLNIAFDEINNKTEEITVKNYSIRTFTTINQILYLCEHGSKHMWDRLKWLCDIHEIIRKEEGLDWGHVWEESVFQGCHRSVAFAWGLIESIWHLPPPEIIGKFLEKDIAVKLLIRKTLKNYTDHEESAKRLTLCSRLSQNCHLFLLKGSLKFWKENLRPIYTPSLSDFSVVKLPFYLYPIYYIIRLYRILSNKGH